MKTLLALAVIGSSLAVAALASAAQPTQADFDACNAAARAAGANPSASPQTGVTGPSATTPSGTPDSTSGVRQGGGGGKTGPMVTGSGRQPGSTGGVREGTGAVTSDSTGTRNDQLSGMSQQGMTDPAYKSAYQECMQRRGF